MKKRINEERAKKGQKSRKGSDVGRWEGPRCILIYDRTKTREECRIRECIGLSLFLLFCSLLCSRFASHLAMSCTACGGRGASRPLLCRCRCNDKWNKGDISLSLSGQEAPHKYGESVAAPNGVCCPLMFNGLAALPGRQQKRKCKIKRGAPCLPIPFSRHPVFQGGG